jgi:hypothetical protein
MPEDDYLNGCLNKVELEFVEREATPRLLMELGIQLRLAVLSLSNTILILKYSMQIEPDPPFTTGFTRQIYSPSLVGIRITLRWVRL